MSSSSQFGPKVWYNGELVPWDQATVHVSAHVLHYGSSVFEGIVERLMNSCKVFRIDVPYTFDEIKQAILDTVRANGHQSCYIRPLIFRGTGALGVEGRRCSIESA